MFKLIKTQNGYGIKLFYLFQLTIEKEKGILIDTMLIKLNVWKFIGALYLGKESRNGKKTKRKIKESKNTYASA